MIRQLYILPPPQTLTIHLCPCFWVSVENVMRRWLNACVAKCRGKSTALTNEKRRCARKAPLFFLLNIFGRGEGLGLGSEGWWGWGGVEPELMHSSHCAAEKAM